MKPAKVKFQPMPVKEETTLAKYMDGTYTGIWAGWVSENFSHLVILEKHYDAMIKKAGDRPSWLFNSYASDLRKIESEILEAVRLAAPYIFKKDQDQAV